MGDFSINSQTHDTKIHLYERKNGFKIIPQNKYIIPQTHYTNMPDSLQILIEKAYSIHTANQRRISFIQSRKGQSICTTI